MARIWKTCFFALLTLDIVGALLIINYFQNESERSLLHYDLSTAISEYKEGREPYVDFSAITRFPWDRMYIFGPYTSCKYINQTLRTFWIGCGFTNIESIGNESLFVFTKDGWVVQYVKYETDLSSPSSAFRERGVTPKESHFVIDKYGMLMWIGNK